VLELNNSFFFQVINFLILIAVLNWLLVKPTLRILEERRQRVEGSEEEAKRLKAENEKILLEYEQSLNEARVTAGQQKERLRLEGIERENEIIRTSREEAKKAVEETKEKIELERKNASLAMKEEVKALSEEITRKVLGRDL
jgi:F-type H+-transporting ATPase subunit b